MAPCFQILDEGVHGSFQSNTFEESMKSSVLYHAAKGKY